MVGKRKGGHKKAPRKKIVELLFSGKYFYSGVLLLMAHKILFLQAYAEMVNAQSRFSEVIQPE